MLELVIAQGRELGCTRTSTWCPPASDERDFDENFAWHVARFRPIAQALALLGAEPRCDSYGRICGARLLPLEQLGRPRIDVIITLSGIFRDVSLMARPSTYVRDFAIATDLDADFDVDFDDATGSLRQITDRKTGERWLDDPRGAALLQPMLQQMMARMGADSEAESPALGMEAMDLMRGVPLRVILRFAGDKLPMPPNQFVDGLLAQVHAALTYYYDHTDEIEAELATVDEAPVARARVGGALTYLLWKARESAAVVRGHGLAALIVGGGIATWVYAFGDQPPSSDWLVVNWRFAAALAVIAVLAGYAVRRLRRPTVEGLTRVGGAVLLGSALCGLLTLLSAEVFQYFAESGE